MKRCPACGKEYAQSKTHCEFDSYPLDIITSQPISGQNTGDPQTLSHLISAQSPFEIKRAARFAIAICDALEDVHSKGQVIGTLNPRDIFIDVRRHTEEQPLSVKLREKVVTAKEHESYVEALYLSPEAAEQQEADQRSDVYSLGIILYEMLTGQPPFRAASQAAVIIKQILESPRPLQDLRPEIPAKLQEIVLRALEKEKSARQQSPAQMRSELTEVLSQMGEELQSVPEAAISESTSSKAEVAACPICHTMNEAEWAFCQSCGSKLSPSAAPRPMAPPVSMQPQTITAPSVGQPMEQMPPESPYRQALPTVASQPPTMDSAIPIKHPYIARSTAEPSQLPSSELAEDYTCQQCGHINGQGSAFCSVCGNSLAVARTIVMSSRSPEPPPVAGRLHLIMEGGQPKEVYDLNEFTVLGRVNGDITFPHDDFMSGRHASVERRGNSYFLKDEGSHNGTFIKIKEETELKSGDIIVIGKQILQMEVEGEVDDSENENDTQADIQTIEANKQCPKCGARYPLEKVFCRFDGYRLVEVASNSESSEQPSEIEPFVIGQYYCFAHLGEGGMGLVYKARHVHLERLSAVKVLLPQTAIQPDAVKMFRREAQLASSINHPNSVTIYDYGEVGAKLFYLAMEFIQGRNLAEVIRPKGKSPRPIPLRRAVSITRQICDALDTAHRAGIIHRDLKPHNVMVCERPGLSDLIKVVDFGIARSLTIKSEHKTVTGAVIGTPAYMSPEQALGISDIDARSDIFSLGLIVYQMLSGTLPFPVEGLTPMQQLIQRSHLKTPPPALSQLQPDMNIPAAVDQVLLKALEPDRNRRIESVVQFIEKLENAIHA